MKKFLVYLDDGRDVYKIAVPAKNENAARKYVDGNGEVVAIKDVTNDVPISTEKVAEALRGYHFGQTEIDLITRALMQMNITE